MSAATEYGTNGESGWAREIFLELMQQSSDPLQLERYANTLLRRAGQQMSLEERYLDSAAAAAIYRRALDVYAGITQTAP